MQRLLSRRFVGAPLVAALLALGGPALAADSALITSGELKDHVGYLASDALEGRGTATKGERLAARYIAQHWERYGLQPGGEDGTWYQSFEVAGRAKIAEGARLTIEAAGWERDFSAGEDMNPFGFSADAEALDLPLVFVGFGVSDEQAGYDDYAGLDVTGKAVIMLRREPNPQGRGSRNAFFNTKAAVAKAKGAKALLIVNDEGHPQGDALLPFTGGRSAGIAAAHVQRSTLVKLFKLMGKDLSAIEAGIESSGKPNSFELGRLKFNLKIDRQPEVARNVLGFLPGSDPKLKDEVVVIGAHYDHLGMGHHGGSLGGRDASGEIHNGADDNASGTAGIIELAQAFASQRPRRSLLFIGFSGEERGLLGSAHFVKHPTLDRKRIAAMVNLDMIGRLRDSLEVGGVGTAKAFPTIVQGALAAEGLKGKLNQSGFGPSDHASFARAGIPVLFLFTGLHGDYHRPSDDVGKLNAEGAAKVARVAQRCVQAIADADERPAFVQVPRSRGQRGNRARLGIYPDQNSEGGVGIRQVLPDSPAAKAGLKDGDLILMIGEDKIEGLQDLMTTLGKCKPGQSIEIKVRRDGKETTIKVKLG